MQQIVMEQVRKTYRIHTRPAGFFGAVRGAFSREIQEIHAVDDISFSLNAGELVGYIGPNGAGKSTTVKLMSGILAPDGGRIEIMGRVPWKQRREHVGKIGVVFGQRSQLWWDTPVSDSFDLLRDIYRIPEGEYRKHLGELVEMLDIGEQLKTPVRQLSLGQRMRCELIAALLHKPEILFLDEPSIGLDAVTKLTLRRFLLGLNKEQGVTMILTTHDMDDIEALCSRVMVIGRGKLLFDGNIDILREQFAPYRVMKVRLREEAGEIALDGVEKITQNGVNMEIFFHPGRIAVEHAIAQLAALCRIADLTVEAPDIEQLVADMYKELCL